MYFTNIRDTNRSLGSVQQDDIPGLWRVLLTGSPRMFVEHVTDAAACIMVPSSRARPILAGVKTRDATTEPPIRQSRQNKEKGSIESRE